LFVSEDQKQAAEQQQEVWLQNRVATHFCTRHTGGPGELCTGLTVGGLWGKDHTLAPNRTPDNRQRYATRRCTPSPSLRKKDTNVLL
jgi:hypothetical protein